MQVVLDFGSRRVFRHPLAVISATRADQVPAALAALEAALAGGAHVAGWLAYELGYALEGKFPPPGDGSLIQLGIYPDPDADTAMPAGTRAWCGPLRPQWDGPAYGARFRAVKDFIAAGDIYQANLSLRAGFAFLGDPWTLYERLRVQSGAGFCGYADDGERQIVSLSPELFFAADADGQLTARPMKGTLARGGAQSALAFQGRDRAPPGVRRPRGGGAQRALAVSEDKAVSEDIAARKALAASEKNRAENLMIVDLIRNDLGRVAQVGSVAVPDLFQVETYPTLHTMVSTVTARRRAGCGPADLLRALFPCGSVTGAPKIRAMEILRGLEASPRGAYCGALGWFAPDGSAAFNVSIRTLTISGDSRSGQRGELGIGGGVVQDSQEDEEYAECLLKARFYETGRPPLSLIETLRWEENGFVRRDAHLARMAASAAVFGLAFDATAAHAALTTAVADAQAVLPPACVSTHEGEVAVAGRPLAAVACESRRGALRVRLTLDESGRFAAQAHTLAPDPPHWTFTVSPRRIDSTDALLRHKTDWRDLYEQAVAEAGTDEVVFVNERGEVCEGARSTVFVERDGVLLTPPVSCGLLPGVLRAELLATGRAREAVLMPGDLKENVWFGNSLRGLIGGVAVL